MRFRLGLFLGFAAGYVLGSKAGRERFEQIRRTWDRVSGSPTVHRATERASEVAGQQARQALYAVQSGVEKAGGAVKERLHGEGEPTEQVGELLAGEESSGGPPGTTPDNVRDAWQG